MVKCIALFCVNKYDPKNRNVSYFNLPHTKDRFNLWANNIGRPDLKYEQLKGKSNKKTRSDFRVCEEHFNAEDIICTKIQKRLKKGSVPVKIICKINSSKSVRPSFPSRQFVELKPSPLHIGSPSSSIKSLAEFSIDEIDFINSSPRKLIHSGYNI